MTVDQIGTRVDQPGTGIDRVGTEVGQAETKVDQVPDTTIQDQVIVAHVGTRLDQDLGQDNPRQEQAIQEAMGSHAATETDRMTGVVAHNTVAVLDQLGKQTKVGRGGTKAALDRLDLG